MGIRALFRKFIGLFADRYRPEQHYMRGPGPKWIAAHARSTASRQTVG
jgi:hypothetical protein